MNRILDRGCIQRITIGPSLTLTGGLPRVFEMWTATLAREMIRLGVYFRAVSVFLQIPGAGELDPARADEFEAGTFFELTDKTARRKLLPPLADALRRLKAPPHVLHQIVPGYQPERRHRQPTTGLPPENVAPPRRQILPLAHGRQHPRSKRRRVDGVHSLSITHIAGLIGEGLRCYPSQ